MVRCSSGIQGAQDESAERWGGTGSGLAWECGRDGCRRGELHRQCGTHDAQGHGERDQPVRVVVKDRTIIGDGPRRVIVDDNANEHAERVALWDAQRRLGIKELTRAVIYSTARPYVAGQNVLALAHIERMYFGAAGVDAGKPQHSR